MTHYTFRNMPSYIGVSLLHIAPELPKIWCKMLPPRWEYIEDVLKHAEEMNEILPKIKDGTADKKEADSLNIKYNDAVKNLRKVIFGNNYMKIEAFSYELNIDKDAVRVRINKDASKGEADAFYDLVMNSPGFIEEDRDYNPNGYKENQKGENNNE